MKLYDSLIEIADKNNLPSDHSLRSAVLELDAALAKSKKDKDFSTFLINAESKALAVYAKYTGKSFIDTDQEENLD